MSKEIKKAWSKILAKYPSKNKNISRKYKQVLPLGMSDLPPRSSMEEVNKRILAVANGHSLTPLNESPHRAKDHCIMPMHKGGYQVVTDPKLIPLMGKKP